MPTRVRKRGNKWVVVEASTGKVKSRHDTKKKALASQRIRESARRKR